jgi:hypothetical protein
MLQRHVQVLVRRDMAEILCATVFEHEVEILRDIHGDANVEMKNTDFPAVEIDASEEFDRLCQVYGTNDTGQLYAERCIGRGPKQLEALAFKPARTRRAAAEQEETAVV